MIAEIKLNWIKLNWINLTTAHLISIHGFNNMQQTDAEPD